MMLHGHGSLSNLEKHMELDKIYVLCQTEMKYGKGQPNVCPESEHYACIWHLSVNVLKNFNRNTEDLKMLFFHWQKLIQNNILRQLWEE